MTAESTELKNCSCACLVGKATWLSFNVVCAVCLDRTGERRLETGPTMETYMPPFSLGLGGKVDTVTAAAGGAEGGASASDNR